jgi:hypothetical protein
MSLHSCTPLTAKREGACKEVCFPRISNELSDERQ